CTSASSDRRVVELRSSKEPSIGQATDPLEAMFPEHGNRRKVAWMDRGHESRETQATRIAEHPADTVRQAAPTTERIEWEHVVHAADTRRDDIGDAAIDRQRADCQPGDVCELAVDPGTDTVMPRCETRPDHLRIRHDLEVAGLHPVVERQASDV